MNIPPSPQAISGTAADARGIHRILVPLDGSRRAAAALPYALALATATAARIVLLAIVEPPRQHAVLPSRAGQEVDERRVALNTAYLDAIATGLRGRGLTVETILRHGDPASTIVDASAEEGGALVAMGTHGRMGLEGARMGLVAQRVVRHAAIATLLVPPGAAKSAGGASTFAAITVTLDGSALAEEALPLAASIATALSVPLDLLSVIPSPVIPDVYGWDEGYYPAPLASEARERADEGATEAYLEATATRLRAAGLAVRTTWQHSLTSRSAGAIAAYLAQEPTGLAVIASHGRGGLLRWLLGSTAEAVLDRAPCPTLIVRSGATSGAPSVGILADSAQHAG